MFTVDYKHDYADHGKILILVKNFEPACPNALFERLFTSLYDQLSFIHSKQLIARSDSGRRDRGAASDSFADLSNDTYSDISDSSRKPDQQSIWLHYVRDYSSVNLSWASFQAHRAILGLIGFCLCTERKHVVDSVQAYLQQKALISETPISGRLFILVPTTEPCDLTIEEVNQIIADEGQKMPQSLLLTAGEILAHPTEQLFNTDISVVKQSHPEEFSVSDGLDGKSGGFGSTKTNSTTALPYSASSLLLTPRVVGTLVDFAAQIRDTLQKTVASINPNAMGGLRKSYASTGTDFSDGESSESGLSGPTGGPTTTSDIGAVRTMMDRLNLEDRRFSTKPYLNYTSNLTGHRATTNQSAAEDAGAVKQRRISGRWKKHLADLALQIGDYDLAQLYYEAALQLLKPLGDHLWIAGSIEGLCSVAVLRRIGHSSYIDSGRRVVRANALANGSVQNWNKNSESSEVGSQKIKKVIHAHPSEFCQQALEALDLYKKAVIDKGMLEETTFKVARLLVTEKQSAKAVDLLDTLVGATLSEEFDGLISKVKRLSTLVELFRELGYMRRAGLVAWLAFDQHIRLPDERQFDTVFRSLSIHHVSTLALNDPDAFVLDGEDSGTASDCSLPSSKQPILRRPVIPASLTPEYLREKSIWFSSSYKSAGQNGGKNTPGGVKRFQRSFRSNKRRFWANTFTFHPTGWAALQVSVICHIIDRLKTEAKLEDAAAISWERGLQLIGFLLSLIDGWPDILGSSQCCTFMEDLCRLAVLRCPDQPRLASSIFNMISDVSGNLDRRLWPRQRNMVSSTGDVDSNDVSTQPRQLVDLVEVPVHKLPVFTKITVIPLPDYLIPCELSQAALASAVPLAVRSPRSGSSELYSTVESGVGSLSPVRIFFYAPTGPDVLGSSHPGAVDWVCEEPVELEFIVDNLLPVDLRLSDLRVELLRVAPGSSKTISPSVPTTIQLEAVRLVVELPMPPTPPSSPGKRSKSTAVAQTGFPVEINKMCLIEAAQDYRLHPRTALNTNWRRRIKTVSCELPAKTSGIRLLVNIVPTTEMLRTLLTVDESANRAYYRICGLTYRLVDFGAMHVCLRVPPTLLEPERKVPPSTDTELIQPRLRRSSTSSSTTSIASYLRSSCNSGLGSLIPSGDRAALEHPTVSIIKQLFCNLPSIRLRPPMPRLHIFPGLIRSAHTFAEACEFLPSMTTPSLGKKPRSASRENPHIQPPWFQPPDSHNWSDNVATVVEATLYPCESRWFPLQLLVRDEAHINLSSAEQIRSAQDLARQLNVFRATIRATDDTNVLLKKLQLSISDIVQCIGMESIQKKLPIPVLNNEIRSSSPRARHGLEAVDNQEEFPFCATDCGLVWLSFHSEQFWRRLALATFIDPKERDRNFRTSKQLFFELRFEYAVDVPCKDNVPSSTTSSSGISSPSFLSIPARRVSFGIHLTFLSSKHSPLRLYSPLLVFHDEPFEDDSDDLDDYEGPPLAHGELRSDAFFYGTLRARLPVSLVPRPIRSLNRQYRVRLNIHSWWRTRPATSSSKPPTILQTPWTSLTELSSQRTNRRQSSFNNETLNSASSLANEMLRCVEITDDQTNTSDSDPPLSFHRICLRLHKLSDVVLCPKPLAFCNPENLRSDEIGLPVPVNPAVAIRAIELNLGIMWQSYLDGRPLSLPDSTDKRTRPQSNVLPDNRFYRFGCLLLATNEIEPWDADNSRGSVDSVALSMSTLSKPWYGQAFSTASSIASLLWCHNLRLRVVLLPPPDGRPLPVCGACSNGPRRRTSIFSRRGSQPLEAALAVRNAGEQGKLKSVPEAEDDPEYFIESRRLSMPERQNPKLLRGLKSDLLSFSSHACARLLEPVSILIIGSVSYHPLAHFRLDEEYATQSPNQELTSCSVMMHRVWTGPVVYEIVQPKAAEPNNTPQLSEPLIEGKDFCFIGTASGKMGLSLASSCIVDPKNATVCAISFFRTGRFWICGLIGLLPPDFRLPSIDSPTPGSFTMPNISNIQTIRFSPNGVSIHIFDAANRKDAGLPPPGPSREPT